MWMKLLTGALSGAAAGAILAMLAGGVGSALYGLPFSGQKGFDVFLPGTLFPGLIIFAPWGACLGAVAGATYAHYR